MPAKTKYSENDILEAAFSVVRKSGWENCTARSIAKELGSSTMPIYSCLSSMEDLKKKIIRKGLDKLLDYQTRAQTRIDFLDMGLGYVLFAKEEQHLFKLLFHDTIGGNRLEEITNTSPFHFQPFKSYAMASLLDRLADSRSLEGFGSEEKEQILYKAWIFSHGLAVLMNNGVISDLGPEDITALLKETGQSLIEGAKTLKRKEKTHE